MNKLLVFSFSLLFILSIHLQAQNDTLWFDSNWKETTKKDASFFRPQIKKKGNGFWIADFYINGQKQMEGLSKHPKNEMYEGQVVWYFEKGNVFQVVHYKEGILNGSRKVYFKSGSIESEAAYKDGKLNGKWKEYYEGGNIKETGSGKNDSRHHPATAGKTIWYYCRRLNAKSYA